MSKKIPRILRVPKDRSKYHRPEGAGNFDNMDDFNIVDSINVNTINCQKNISGGSLFSSGHFSGASTMNISGSNLYVGANGNVGIGTNSPNNKLQVAGLINFDETNKNNLLGTEVFNNDIGEYNFGMGYRAGYNNDSSGGGGKYNFYLGYRAG